MKNELSTLFTPKQIQALQSPAKILILDGAKRSGKTTILLWKFLLKVKEFKNQNKKFIMGGATFESIQTNLIDELQNITGMTITIKNNRFYLLGNQILLKAGMNADAWKRARGFTAQGAILNEMTALHETFIMECISRCSEKDSFILGDTNTENPYHFVKTNFIDKSGQKLENGKLNIDSIHFALDDNTFLDTEYVESIKKATPTGFFYKRDILGLWVAAEGVVYEDYDPEIHVIEKIPTDVQPAYYLGGIDYGYTHFGVCLVVMVATNGNYYVVECKAKQKQYIEFWGETAKSYQAKYYGIIFYCDPARPDHNDKIRKTYGIKMGQTNNSVFEGIQTIGSLLKQKRLFFIKDKTEQIQKEMYLYTWKTAREEEKVNKTDDDALDALRYAIYSDFSKGKSFVTKKPFGF